MKYIILAVICLVICAQIQESTQAVIRLREDSANDSGIRTIVLFREVNGEQTMIKIECDSDSDCAQKLNEEVQHIFLRFG